MAQNDYRAATLLFDLVERLRRGEPLSRKLIMEHQGCKRGAAGDRFDWIEERFNGRLMETRDAQGRPARRLATSTAEPSGDALLPLIAGRMATSALESLRGTRLHAALISGQRANAAGLASAEFDQVSRVVNTYMRYEPVEVPDTRRQVIDVLFDAIVARQAVTFGYRPLGRGEVRYRVEPYLLVDYRGALYLYGRKVDGAGPDPTEHRRNFGIDGIRDIRIDQTYRTSPPPDARQRLHADLETSLGFFRVRSGPDEVRLRASGWFADRLRRHPLHRSQVIADTAGDAIEVTLRVRICPELCSTLMGALPEVVVLAPAGLIDIISERIEAARLRFATSGSDPDRT